MYVRQNRLEKELHNSGNQDGAFESMLNRFNRKVNSSGIFKDMKKAEFFEKPSIKRRRKKREALARMRRRERKNAVYQTGTKRRSRPRDKQPDRTTARVQRQSA